MSSKKTLLARKASEMGVQTPLPVYQISCILFVQICEALNINVLFPFVAFMVEDMGFTGNALGYHAGLMAAAFCFAQFFTAVPWGMVSDKYGRRPTIIVGTLGSGLGMLVFGLARTFPQAVAARVLSGLLSGNLGVVKSLLTEITDDSNRGAAFSYMSLAWAIGTVIAPLAGGMLCKPTEKYPTVFPSGRDSLFEEFPYLLPCLVCFFWSIFSALWCFCFMKETRNQAKPTDENTSSKGLEMVAMGKKMSTSSSVGSLTSSVTTKSGYSQVSEDDGDSSSKHTVDLYEAVRSPLGDIESGIDEDYHAGAQSPSSKYSRLQSKLKNSLSEPVHPSAIHISEETLSPLSPLSPISANKKIMSPKGSFTIDAEGDSDEESGFEGPGLSIARGGAAAASSNGNGNGAHVIRETQEGNDVEEGVKETDSDSSDDEEEDVVCCSSSAGSQSNNMDSSSHNLTSSEDSSSSSASTSEPKKLSTATVLRQRVVLLATSNYGILCMAAILIDETLPLFLKAPINEGGFEFNSMHIGFLLSISGCVMLLFTSFVLPVVSRRSKFWMFRVGTIGSIPVALCFPFVALLNRKVLLLMPSAWHSWILWTVLPLVTVMKNVFACFSFGAVMIQVNHSVHDEYLGAVNGLGQSMAALARAIGPALGGALWSVSTKHHFVYLNFIVASVVYAFLLYLNQLMPPSLDFKKRIPKRLRGLQKGGDAGAGAPMFH